MKPAAARIAVLLTLILASSAWGAPVGQWKTFPFHEAVETTVLLFEGGHAEIRADKSLDAKVLAHLPDETVIWITQMDTRPNGNPRFAETDGREIWFKIAGPVQGWILADQAAIWYSDILSGIE